MQEPVFDYPKVFKLLEEINSTVDVRLTFPNKLTKHSIQRFKLLYNYLIYFINVSTDSYFNISLNISSSAVYKDRFAQLLFTFNGGKKFYIIARFVLTTNKPAISIQGEYYKLPNIRSNPVDKFNITTMELFVAYLKQIIKADKHEI